MDKTRVEQCGRKNLEIPRSKKIHRYPPTSDEDNNALRESLQSNSICKPNSRVRYLDVNLDAISLQIQTSTHSGRSDLTRNSRFAQHTKCRCR